MGVTIVECPAKQGTETFVATDGTECATESERFWYETMRGIEPPRREMSPDTICENEITFVTEDKDNWIVNWYDSRKEPMLHSKKREPEYPIALVAKWGYRTVNRKRMDEICDATDDDES